MKHRHQLQHIEDRINMLTFSGEIKNDEHTLIESIKMHLHKLNPTMLQQIKNIKTMENMRDACATIANGLIAFGERTLDVTVLKIKKSVVEFAKSNMDSSPTEAIQAASDYLSTITDSFTPTRSRYKFVYILLGFVYHYDKRADDNKANMISLLRSMMASLEIELRENNPKLIILDPKSVEPSDGTLWEMISMINDISSTPEYQRCFIMLTIWMTFPANLDLKDEATKKILYSILARYIQRRSLIICNPENSPNQTMKNVLENKPQSVEKAVLMIQALDDSIPNTSLDHHYDSFQKLKKAVYEINTVIKPLDATIPGEELESHFDCRHNIHTMLLSGADTSTRELIANMTVGKLTDLFALPTLFLYRAFDGSETVTLFGRTYKDGSTLFGEYQGNWHIFKGHSGLTWKQWLML